VVDFWCWSRFKCGFQITFSFSSSLCIRGFFGHLLAFLIQPMANLYYTWQNDWRWQDNASTTFWDRSDRRLDLESGLIWKSWFKSRITFGWNFGIGRIGLHSLSAVVYNCCFVFLVLQSNVLIFSSSAACIQWSLQCSWLMSGWMDGWMSVCCLLLSNHYCSSYSFWRILIKLGTRDLCANMQKTVQQIFEILILKFLTNFWNFTFGLSFRSSSSSGAV